MASTQFTANSNGEKGGKKFGFWALIIVITLAVLILIFNSFTVVNEGYIGVKYQFGKIVSSDLSAGLNMHMPFIEEIQQVDNHLWYRSVRKAVSPPSVKRALQNSGALLDPDSVQIGRAHV